jgi:cardiolipin synthase
MPAPVNNQPATRPTAPKAAGPKPAAITVKPPKVAVDTWRHRGLVSPAGKLPVERVVLDNPTYHNQITLHPSADESRQALLDSIKNAKSSFYIETFIWHNDEAGREIAQALIDRKKQAAAEGKPFDVKVLIDYGGLHDATNPTDDTKIVKFMTDNGIDVQLFNPTMINPLATGSTPITHRKLYIQDGTQFTTGGRNIGDEYLMSTFVAPKGGGQEKAWHDLLFTVRGDETGRVIDEFYKNWRRAGGTVPAVKPTIVPAMDGHSQVQSFVTDPLKHVHDIRDAEIKAIANAQSEIIVCYPYLSDDELVQALIDAKKANPKLSIKVMIPAKGEKGLPGFLYNSLNVTSARQLMEAGIEVRKVDAHKEGADLVTSFSHMKAMVFDGKLLSIGSANGDQRTMANNNELNTLIYDPALGKEFKDRVLMDDWNRSAPMTLAEVKNRPWYMKVVDRVLEALDFLF